MILIVYVIVYVNKDDLFGPLRPHRRAAMTMGYGLQKLDVEESDDAQVASLR